MMLLLRWSHIKIVSGRSIVVVMDGDGWGFQEIELEDEEH